jgi:chitin disaccharide deacetylase
MRRHLIVNADDFGLSAGVNRGIADCHLQGVVTSASLMVGRPGTLEAVAMSRELPDLAIGLHWDCGGEGLPELDHTDPGRVREAFHRQLDRFHQLLGRGPTHVDSEAHAHREHGLLPIFQELVEPLGVPLRHDGTLRFVGAFYAQWRHGVSEPEHVSPGAFREMLSSEVREGWTEFSCHPGYCSPEHAASLYYEDREVEVSTLTDPSVRREIERLGIRLASYADFNRARMLPAG